MMPWCDQTGVPIHFHSSTASGSASLMSLRILLRVSPRQSPSSAILFEMSSDADWPWLAPDSFMFSSSEVLHDYPLLEAPRCPRIANRTEARESESIGASRQRLTPLLTPHEAMSGNIWQHQAISFTHDLSVNPPRRGGRAVYCGGLENRRAQAPWVRIPASPPVF